MNAPVMERRDFLKFTVAASGGLLIGIYLPTTSKLARADEDSVALFELLSDRFAKLVE